MIQPIIKPNNAKERERLRILVAMLGAKRHYAIPRMLHQAGMLERFYTDAYIGNKPWLERFISLISYSGLGLRGFKELLGRKEPEIPSDKVISFDLFGLWYWWKHQKKVQNSAIQVEFFAEVGRRFDELIIARGLSNVNVVYGFNGASLELFRHAKERECRCVFEQTIAPRKILRQLLLNEVERWPGWQPDLILSPDKDSFVEREEEEWKLADLIIDGSEFVVNSLIACGVSKDKCRVVPYGMDFSRFNCEAKSSLKGRRLRVLFVGEVGLRKGIPYLLEAIRLVGAKHIKAKLAGPVSLGQEKVDSYNSAVEFLGVVPRIHIADLYSWADVLVLPTICDGFGNVQIEALANGLPVIATPNCGSVVRDGVDGHIVPIRDPEAIASVLEAYINDPALVAAEQDAAYKGRERYSLEAYQERLIEVLESFSYLALR